MKYYLRRRYVPPHYHREIQRRFRTLTQGGKSVEEYYEEFEQLKNRLELDDSEEALMAQFVDGLSERIARKVERQPYHQIHELLHLAIQVEQQIKRKASTYNQYNRNKSNTNWTPPAARSFDKGKNVEAESKFKKSTTEVGAGSRPEHGKSSNQVKSRDIICFKCQGRGHMARECPNQRVMIITANGDYESQDEPEDECTDQEEDIEYADVGDLLVTRRVLSTLTEPEETIQRENIFHTRCTINTKVCGLIIDGGSCTNVASKYMVDRLGLKKTKHPTPYKLRWLNDQAELKINEQVIVPFSVGKYHDQVVCDVVPMQASHLLLGRPWQFDRETNHNGHTNFYSFTYDKRKYNLAPLTPTQVHDMQTQLAKETKLSKTSLYISPSSVCKSLSSNHTVLLMIFKEVLISGFEHLDLPKEITQLLNRFEDVFPEDIPAGLPPIRGIEHQIDLVPGSALPNRPAYRINPEEAKELERQVQELMSKGYIRESLSPCAVPVLLVTQERWHMENVCRLPSHQQDHYKI